MTTFVLVHGGSHGGWCWRRVAPLLTSSGHEVYTPTLSGLGERAHLLNADVDLDLHITDIVNVLVYEDLRKVILVGHSYGGMVITGAADRALDRIAQLVYLDASIPVDGESQGEETPEAILEAVRSSVTMVNGAEVVEFPGTDPRNYGITEPADIEWMQPKLRPHPWKCITQKISLPNESALSKIPRTMINCTDTLRRRDPNRVHRALSGDRVWEIDTSHDLMITEPETVADMLLRLG